MWRSVMTWSPSTRVVQAVVAGDAVQPAAVAERRVAQPFEGGQQRHVGQCRIARPDPDETVRLVHREAADGREAAHALAGHGDGLAVAAHGQAVVAADEGVAVHAAQRQRRAAVRAEVLHRADRAGAVAEQGHRMVADLAAQRLVGADLVAAGGHVPGVGDEHDVLC
jgi:phage terminase large subunit-like protein